jgi:tRNA dimethylallyltransferase
MLGLWREKDDTNRRINKRIHEMFDEWLIDEVRSLLDQWYSPSLQSMQWIWYKEVVDYLQRKINKSKCEELIKRNTHYLAKKQRTWFRRYIADSKNNTNTAIVHRVYILS